MYREAVTKNKFGATKSWRRWGGGGMREGIPLSIRLRVWKGSWAPCGIQGKTANASDYSDRAVEN